MATVRHLLTPDPPERLYHYTQQAGLLGIIGNKEIWATHTNYLNDQQEFQHGLDFMAAEIQGMRRDMVFFAHQQLLEQMEDAVKNIRPANVCVCSFSENPDTLSQWRAYGDGGGFSIGFSGHFLKSICDAQKFWLVRCLYDDGEKRACMKMLLGDVLQEFETGNLTNDNEFIPLTGNLSAYLMRYAPLLKHGAFAEEKEWRIITRPLPCTSEQFAFRPGIAMLTPYYRMPLATEDLPFEVEEVIVGPSPHPEQSERSVKSYLVSQELESTDVRRTAVPYRNW